MENVASGPKESESKQSNFAMLWKDLFSSIDSSRNALQTRLEELEQHLKSEQNSLQTRSQELHQQFALERSSIRTREQELQDREKEMEAKVLNFQLEIESITKQLCSIESLIEKKGKEVDGKEKRLLEVEKLVKEKERDCTFISKCIEDRSEKLKKYNEEILLKGSELNKIRGSIEEATKLFDLKQDQVKGMQKSVEECHHLSEKLNKYNEEITLKGGELNAIRGSIEEATREFDMKQNKVQAMQKSVEECLHRSDELNEEIKLKGAQLNKIRGSIEEAKQDQVKAMQKSVEERHHLSEKLNKYNEEIELKGEQLNVIRESIEEATRVFYLKQDQVQAMQKSVEECHQQMTLKIDKLESMEKTMARLQGMLDKYCEDIDVKRRQLNGIREDVDVKQRQLSSTQGSIEEGKNVTDEQVIEARKSLEQCNKEINLKRVQLTLIQKSMVECTNIRESREKIIMEMDAKVKDFGLLKKSMEEWSCKLGTKERELEGWVEKLEFREKQVESKLEELSLIDKRVSECLSEVQLKGQQFDILGKLIQERKSYLDSQESSLQELSCRLGMRESKLGEQAKDLELKQKQILSTINSMEEHIQNLKSNGKTFVHSEVEIDQHLVCTPANVATVSKAATSSSPSPPLNSTTSKGNLGRPPNDLLSENHSVLKQNKMFLVLQSSADPGKLVLKLMQLSFSECWGKGNVGFQQDFMKKCLSMLKDLRKVLPDAGTHPNDDAMRLAVQWKAKMRAETENSLEIVCFLEFIATFGCLSMLNEDEIVKFLELICQHTQARELCQTHGFADKIPDLVQNLTERKQLIVAVGFICSFNLTAKFSPSRLLKRYVEHALKSYCTKLLANNSLDEKEKVVDSQIADLRAAIRCVKDNNLDSQFPSKDIEAEIDGLEKLKENWRCSVSSVASEVEHQEKVKQKKRGRSNAMIPLELLRRSKRLEISE